MKKFLTIVGALVAGTLAASTFGFAGVAASTATSAAPVADWTVDAPHTEINFAVNHFFTPVNGTFDDFEITLDYDPEQPENSSVEARISVTSVNTGNEQRDAHLRTGDFFAAEEHPHITFRSTSVEETTDGTLLARGPLTIRGTTKEIEMQVELLGVQSIPEEMREMLGGAQEVASFKASTSIDRGDFGVGTGSWAATVVVGGTVDIEILVEAHKK